MPFVSARSRRFRKVPGMRPALFSIEILEPRQLLAADLVISEFMASNDKTLADVDGDYPDWIEIYNRGDTAADLTGWHLTNSTKNLAKWTFPSQTLSAGAFLVVFASGKDRAVAGQQLHTGFKLDAAHSYLALVTPDGAGVQFEYAPEYPQQYTDMSYGIEPGSIDPVYFTTPTPGQPNQLIADLPNFSDTSRTFTGTLALTLTANDSNAQIRYTIDRTSPINSSKLYTGPISITNTTIVRARIYLSGVAPGAVVSESFIALDSTVSSFKSNLPVVVVDSFGRGLNDSSLTAVTSAFIETGADGYADFLDTPDFAGRAGFRYRGQSSQGFPKAPYALETWDENNKDRSVSILGMPAESDWILYNPYSEKSLMQNYLAYMWANRMGQYAVRTRYVELFVNLNGDTKINYASDYVGVYILMEKIKRDPNRVDIAALTPLDNTEPDITGGYIFKKDKFDGTADEKSFTTNSGQTLLYVEPKGNEVTVAQQAYLTGYINSFEAALYGTNFKDPVNGYAKYIDVASFIDNWIMVELTKNIDGFRLSAYFYKDRGGKIVMGPIWDYNLSLGNADYYGGQSATGWYCDQLGDGDYPYFRRLLQDPDFKQRLVDRWQELRAGKFSTERFMSDVDGLVSLLSDGNGNYPVGQNPPQVANNPVVRNFKKWNVLGVYLWPNGYWSDPTWIGNVNWMRNFIKNRSAWIDTQYLAAPAFSVPQGVFTDPFQLAITTTGNKPIYYTLDGSDPRLPGGAISTKAKLYQGPITITDNTRIQARTCQGVNWSGPATAIYALDDGLRITELMYHPANPPQPSPYIDEDFEFIELRNLGAKPINLIGDQFTNGIDFTFPDLLVAPGQRAVLAKNPDAFRSRYGSSITVVGPYTGNLENAGETLRLQGAIGQIIQDFKYNNWYPITDGQGFSLVALNPMAGNTVLSTNEGWRPSSMPGGAPGDDDPGLPDDALVINEIQSCSADADWVELLNTTPNDIDISGWFLSNSDTELQKYQVQPHTIVPAHGYYLFTQSLHFGQSGAPGANSPFSFSDRGDRFFLSSSYNAQLGGYRESVDFGAADYNLTFGRYTKANGKSDFVALSSPTPNDANAYPRVGPIVINEIMYNPLTGKDEFLELKNITSLPIALFDPAHPENAWKFTAGITFTFTNGNQIPANGYALVVPISPTTFRTKYSIPATIPIFGPFTGFLDGAGETLELSRPAVPEPGGFVAYPVVDHVSYNDSGAWPTAPDGTGPSLARIAPTTYGNDVVNWTTEVSGGSPGRLNVDKLPPNVRILPVIPNPHDTPVSSLTIAFDETITGFDISDLKLTREGASTNLLTSTQTLTDTGNGQTFSLGNLAGITWRAGAYALTLTATDSSIADISRNALATDAALDFALTTTTVTGFAADDNTFIIKTLADSVLIFVNVPTSAKPTYVISSSELASLAIFGGTGDDVLTIQSSLPFIPVFNPGPGNNQLTLTSGTHTLDTDGQSLNVSLSGPSTTHLTFNSVQHLGRLSLSGAASASIAPGGDKPLQLASLSINGSASLDLADNDLIVQSTDLNAIAALIRSARADGTWTGSGIKTSQSTGATGLAAVLSGDSVLVKYSWNGDANLDGLINADDYFLIDSGFVTQLGGYTNGDFNYDAIVNADDYFLIDSAFIAQTGPLSANAPDSRYAGPLSAVSAPSSARRSAYEDLFSSDPIPVDPF